MSLKNWKAFHGANTMQEVMEAYEQLLREPSSDTHLKRYEALRSLYESTCPRLFGDLETKRARPAYQEQPLRGQKILIVGAGPAGLTAAIEYTMLGAEPVVVEARPEFHRHNVMLLWEQIVEYLRHSGFKALHPAFSTGDLHHVGIRRMQVENLKICMLLGVPVISSCRWNSMKSGSDGWTALVERNGKEETLQWNDKPLHFDVLIGADGLSSSVAKWAGFKYIVQDGQRAIGCTFNYENHHTPGEIELVEGGFCRYMRQQWFDELEEKEHINIENCVYYRDETNYFVCTPSKETLLELGLVKEDHASVSELLQLSNQNPDALAKFADTVASAWGLDVSKTELIKKENGQPDVSLFDFTQKHAATETLRFVPSQGAGKELPTFLLGDALLEPFWPQGTGANRAIVGVLDVAFTMKELNDSSVSRDTALEHSKKLTAALFACTPDDLREGEQGIGLEVDPTHRYRTIFF